MSRGSTLSCTNWRAQSNFSWNSGSVEKSQAMAFPSFGVTVTARRRTYSEHDLVRDSLLVGGNSRGDGCASRHEADQEALVALADLPAGHVGIVGVRDVHGRL